MSQLTAKELRFADMAISTLADGPQRRQWTAWYSAILQEEDQSHSLFVVPAKMSETILRAIRSEKRRMQAAIGRGEPDDSDLINDLEVFLHIERGLKLEAVA
jgi:hypothetical protein